MNNEHKDHKISLSDFDFERSSYINETDLKGDRRIRFTFRNVKTFDYGRRTDLAISRGHRIGYSRNR